MNVNQTTVHPQQTRPSQAKKEGVLTHRRFPGLQLLLMGGLLILDSPQRIQRLISLIPRLSRFGQRAQEFSLGLFLRSRELGRGILSRAF